jgi:hypothetical protein
MALDCAKDPEELEGHHEKMCPAESDARYTSTNLTFEGYI